MVVWNPTHSVSQVGLHIFLFLFFCGNESAFNQMRQVPKKRRDEKTEEKTVMLLLPQVGKIFISPVRT